jgi:hypothetical protein
MLLGDKSGLGDVVGPASSVDRGLAVFDGITGKLINDSTDRLYPKQATDPVAPSPTVSDLYYNTVIDELMIFDGNRGKFLSVGSFEVQAGRNGNTAAGSFYRAVNGMVLNATNRAIPVPKGTLTRLAWSRTDSDSATLEVLRNGTVIATLASTASGDTQDNTVDADFDEGRLSFRNLSSGNTTSNVQIRAVFKRRA